MAGILRQDTPRITHDNLDLLVPMFRLAVDQLPQNGRSILTDNAETTDPAQQGDDHHGTNPIINWLARRREALTYPT